MKNNWRNEEGKKMKPGCDSESHLSSNLMRIGAKVLGSALFFFSVFGENKKIKK